MTLSQFLPSTPRPPSFPAGLFLSFQSPIEVPGVSNVDFLRMACNARRKVLGQPELDPLEFYAHVMPKVQCGGGMGCGLGWVNQSWTLSSSTPMSCPR